MRKAILVESNERFRDGLVSILNRTGQLGLSGTSGNAEEFKSLFSRSKPGFLLLDTSIPACMEIIEYGIRQNPGLKILGLYDSGSEENFFALMKAGMKGFISRSSGMKELEHAVREVFDGNYFFSNEVLRKVFVGPVNDDSADKDVVASLTNQEKAILKLTADSISPEEMVVKLKMNSSLLNSCRNDLLAKTACSNSASLVLFAIRNKIVEV
jgi:DNA-binding NarL/FixJ family response regulator